MRIKEMAIFAALAICVMPAFAQQAGSGSLSAQDGGLAAKIKATKAKAAAVTQVISTAAASGSLPQDPQALQSLIDQLKSISDRLTNLENEVNAMKGKQAEAPKLAAPSPLGKTTVGGYVQLQYRSSENRGEF